MTNEKEKTCVWEVIKMGDWHLFRASCGGAKYTRDTDWSGTTCSCGGVVLLEPNLDPKDHGTVILEPKS